MESANDNATENVASFGLETPAIGCESCRVTDVLLQDAGESAALQAWLPIRYRQLSPGAYQGRFRELTLPGQRFVVETQNRTIHKQGVMAAASCTVSFARLHTQGWRFSEYNAHPSAVFFLPGGCEFDVKLPENTEIVYFSFNQAEFLADALALHEHYWSACHEQLLLCPTPFLAQLSAFADAILHLMRRYAAGERPENAQLLSRLLMAGALAAFDTSAGARAFGQRDTLVRQRALQIVRRTVEYIDHALANLVCPTIADLCRQTALSQRSLQYAFLEVLHMTPMVYLRIARLHCVRDSLRDRSAPYVTVGDAAARYGFWHLGKFAADYYRQFGERPSDTLRRR